jgi:hypothetical protein
METITADRLTIGVVDKMLDTRSNLIKEKDAEISRLRTLIRCETIQPPADITDDLTTELVVENAGLVAEISALKERLALAQARNAEIELSLASEMEAREIETRTLQHLCDDQADKLWRIEEHSGYYNEEIAEGTSKYRVDIFRDGYEQGVVDCQEIASAPMGPDLRALLKEAMSTMDAIVAWVPEMSGLSKVVNIRKEYEDATK